MLQDVHTSNKSTLDFKNRILLQQKKETEQTHNAQRKKEDQEMGLMKVKQKLSAQTNKKKYYEDLGQQNLLRKIKDKNITRLSQQEIKMNQIQ